MPDYHYECRECEQDWYETHSIEDRYNATCPSCETHGSETMQLPDGQVVSKVMILPPRIHIRTRDAVERETPAGHDRVHLPQLGRNVFARTEKERQEAYARARETYFKATDGDRRVLRPFKDDKGRTVMDFVTSRRTGTDIGQLVDMRELGAPQETTLERKSREADEKVAGKRKVRIPKKLRQAKNVYTGAE